MDVLGFIGWKGIDACKKIYLIRICSEKDWGLCLHIMHGI